METGTRFLERLWDPVAGPVWAAAGAILAHLWRRYRNRMVALRWQASHHSLATAAQDVVFGTIEVRYNGAVVQNLFLTTVDVQNESSRDLTDVNLNLVFQDGTTIYMAHGAVVGSANVLPFANPFAAELDRFLALPADDPAAGPLGAALSRRRDFCVPVLNRGVSVRIAMLVEASPGRQPFVQLSCDHPGLRLLFQPPRQLLFGVDQRHAALVGFLAGGILVVVVTAAELGPWSIATVAFLIGSLTAVLGAALVRATRWIARALS